jgi:hypothetical protein
MIDSFGVLVGGIRGRILEIRKRWAASSQKWSKRGVLTGSRGYTSKVTGKMTGRMTGKVTGRMTGKVTGRMTGKVTGMMIGKVTGRMTSRRTGMMIGKVTGTSTVKLTAGMTGGSTALLPSHRKPANGPRKAGSPFLVFSIHGRVIRVLDRVTCSCPDTAVVAGV